MQASAAALLLSLQEFTSRTITHELDHETKEQLYVQAKRLMFQVEPARQACDRLYGSILPADMAQLAVDLSIFRTLAADPTKLWATEDLAAACGADPILLHRILRFLAAEGYVAEQDAGVFQASSQSIALASSGAEAGLKHNRLNVSPAFTALPDFFKQTGYANPSDTDNTAFHAAFAGNSIMKVLTEDPERAAATLSFMASQREGARSWMDIPAYLSDLHLSASDLSRDRILLVDVGGGSGHQPLLLRQKLPSLRGRLVLQDIEAMISQTDAAALAAQHIQPMVHDFNTAQPAATRGAKVYYLRNVLHDWPDAVAGPILRHLVDAMAPDSVVVIDEAIVPARGAAFRQVCYDAVMMAVVAAHERSLVQWERLVDSVGLQVRDVWRYEPATEDYLIVCVKKEK